MEEEYKNRISGFSLDLNEEEAGRLMKLLSDEGLMRAGFVAHQANNCNVTVDLKPLKDEDC